MSNASMTLYTGVTNDVARRASEHRSGQGGFTARYHCHKLVWHERLGQVKDAIAREKELKGWSRKKKIALISASNPRWVDVLEGGED